MQREEKNAGQKAILRFSSGSLAITVIGAVYYYEVTLPSSSSAITLYVGEASSTAYGFGNASNTLTSNPGPQLTLKAGQTYTVTVYNVGTMQHNWAIVDTKSSTATVLWSSATPFINPGSNAKVTFQAGSAGSYFYICQIPGHVALGLWGSVEVNS